MNPEDKSSIYLRSKKPKINTGEWFCFCNYDIYEETVYRKAFRQGLS